MREKRGLIVYLIGSLMLSVSVFLPYFRYKFVLEGLIEYKESYDLMHLKDLEEFFSGFGKVSTSTRIIIYMVVFAGILGIVIGLFQILANDNYYSVVTFSLMNMPALIALIANIKIAKDKMISAVSDVIHNYENDLISQGFSGSSGYGIGFFLLLAGMILVILGVIIHLVDTQFS